MPPRQVLSIQYLRGLAALLVVLHHARNPQPWLFNPLDGFMFGAAGVDVFFVISGFIMFTAARSEAVADFARRRLLRVAPLYWLATLGFLTFSLVLNPDGVTGWTPAHLVKSLLFIPHESPIHPGEAWPLLVPGWTLNFEMFFYAVFAVAIVSGRVVLTTCAIILGLVAFGLLVRPAGPIAAAYTSPLMLEFLAGVLVGKAWASRPFAVLWPLLPLGVAALLLVASPAVAPEWHALGRMVPAVAIVIGALALEPLARARPSAGLKLVGDASYAIYLSHIPTLMVVTGTLKRLPLEGWPQFAVLVAAAVAASVAVGVAVHLWVETPLLRQLGRMGRARRPAVATA